MDSKKTKRKNLNQDHGTTRRIEMEHNSVVSTGISMGCGLAMILSWNINKSILWAILHGIFSWLYVIYYAMTY